MSTYSKTQRRVIALAYFHRYGWLVAMMGCIALWPLYMLYIMGVSMIVFSIWSLVGYRRKWRHIYCSYQNAYHKEMTPHSVRWHQIKKSDAYGIPLIFLIMGFATLCIAILY